MADEEARLPDIPSEEGKGESEKEREAGATERERVAELQRKKVAQREPVTNEEGPPRYAPKQIPVCRALQTEKKMREQGG